MKRAKRRPGRTAPAILERGASAGQGDSAVTEQGPMVLARTFGVPDLKLAEPWNRGRKEDPHVGSVLLPHAMLTLVAVFVLLESGHEAGGSP